MNIIKKLKTIRISEELKLSIMIHFSILLAASAFFVWTHSELEKKAETVVVPVQLIASVSEPKLGAVVEEKTQISSKKTEGFAEEVIKTEPEQKNVVEYEPEVVQKPQVETQQPEKTQEAKEPVTESEELIADAHQDVEAQDSAVTEQIVEMPVETRNISETSDPIVVQKPVQNTQQVRPSHTTPTFDSISRFELSKSTSSKIRPEISGRNMSRKMPSIPLPKSPAGRVDHKPAADKNFIETGTETEEVSSGSGIVEIGEIESFGGSSENFSAPSIISRVIPQYPEWARKAGERGAAVYRVLIQRTGRVADVVTMSSTIDPKLAITGSQALRRWVFTPVLVDGEPKETWVKITVQYRLN